MWIVPLSRGPEVFLTAALFTGLLLACSGEPPTAPADLAPSAARVPKPGGGSGITISSVDPDTVTTDTVITVRVLGSGFTAGSSISWALAGEATDAVTTVPPVLFVSPSEFRAKIAVRRDAPLARYDVVVTAMGGKKGIGVEKLEIVAKPILLPVPAWATSSAATDINDQGVIVGWGAGKTGPPRPLRWTPEGSDWVVEELSFEEPLEVPGFLDLTINNHGYIVLCKSTISGYDPCTVRAPSGVEVRIEPRSVQGLNDRGTIIGFDQATARWVALRGLTSGTWSGPIPLPARVGYSVWGLMDINEEDGVAGGIQDAAGRVWPAFWRWNNGGWAEPELVDTESSGVARAINDRGAMAGEAVWPCGGDYCPTWPTFWSSVQAPRALLPVEYNPQDRSNLVQDMNDADLIVGTALFKVGKRGGSVTHAVVWRPGLGAPRDLGAFRPSQYSEAYAINNGWPAVAVGRTLDASWSEHATAWIVF